MLYSTVHRMALRIASKHLSSSTEPLLTVPYLEKLVIISDWGVASAALSKLVHSLRSEWSGVEPFPVSELWEYLKERGVSEEELSRLRSVPLPRAKSRAKSPDFAEAYRVFSGIVGKSVFLLGIDPDQDVSLIPELVV